MKRTLVGRVELFITCFDWWDSCHISAFLLKKPRQAGPSFHGRAAHLDPLTRNTTVGTVKSCYVFTVSTDEALRVGL